MLHDGLQQYSPTWHCLVPQYAPIAGGHCVHSNTHTPFWQTSVGHEVFTPSGQSLHGAAGCGQSMSVRHMFGGGGQTAWQSPARQVVGGMQLPSGHMVHFWFGPGTQSMSVMQGGAGQAGHTIWHIPFEQKVFGQARLPSAQTGHGPGGGVQSASTLH
jgi:hypothetical protein